MITIEQAREFADTFLSTWIRKSLRMYGMFPLSLIRLHEDDKAPNGWTSSLAECNDEEGNKHQGRTFFLGDDDVPFFSKDLLAMATDPTTLGVVYVLPIQKMEEDGVEKGPMFIIGIHLRGWTKAEDRSDMRLMYYTATELLNFMPGDEVYADQFYNDYLLDYIKARKDLPGLEDVAYDQFKTLFDKTTWPLLKPKFKDFVVNSEWGGDEIPEHPVSYPFEEDFGWTP